MKQAMRKKMITQRESLEIDQVKQKSNAIHHHLFQTEAWKKANHMMIYLDFRNEVQTFPLIELFLAQNKHIYIPVTNPSNHHLTVSELKEPSHDLQVAHFGLLEPKPEALRPSNPQILDLVIVPGVVFDREGYRVGFGAGYYDRFLPKLQQNTHLISLVYDFQLVPSVPREPHDIPVQWIVTESEIINCKKTGSHS
ncbi:5-formyltetrahydrofolate cyclo-ligase [Tindallia magadiensis]|uniref:5-formyltetrahydrofolate cyclo-ligase n=1 Tax=Tindallia magadiensis TaxID=69895 RepID=A0A1I3F897_9FIRM|nr:5-formyltetrahydrofolate cyclo-ligase [Tindallia magadiensis]SFI07429.1 5-formyltetrahydrofolate cyclo-ligase [Tindallia magadiensis]